MNKVLIIGQRPDEAPALASGAHHTLDGNLSKAQLKAVHQQQSILAASQGARGYSAVADCRGVEDLLVILHRIHQRSGPIDLLDIVDHGHAGQMLLGDDTLFEFTGNMLTVGADLPSRLRPYLVEDASLRLLGCKTALGARGRAMLVKIGNAFGGRILVYGTIGRVEPGHFEDGEFSQARDLLFSSEAAIDNDAPIATQRTDNLGRWL